MKSIRSKITIRNLTRRQIPNPDSIRKIIRKVLKLEKGAGLYLSVTYVNDSRIRKLNKKYRGKDSSTDVLAFSMKEGKHIAGENKFLGDIVISLDAAQRQAKYFKTTVKKELKLYLIHGVLHLLGYDDEKKPGLLRLKKRQEDLFTKV